MREIQITGAHCGNSAKVSDEDYDRLSGLKWYLVKGYAQCTIKGKAFKMHRMIANAISGEIIDHIDRDKLNNTRGNLRSVSHAINSQNRGLARKNRKRNFTGVEKCANGFRAVVTRSAKRIVSPLYKTELAAAIKYNFILSENKLEGKANSIHLPVAQQKLLLDNDILSRTPAKLQSGIVGITYREDQKRWIVRKIQNGKRCNVGKTRTLNEALVLHAQ
jgi:predicted lipase